MAKQKLKTERLYHTLLESIPHVIWIADSDGQVTFLNKTWQEWTGRDIEDSLGTKWTESLHPEDAPGLLAKREQAFAHGEPYEGECRLKIADRSYKIIAFSGTPVRDDSGKVSNWVGIDIDITERKEAEEKIQQSLHEKKLLLKEIDHRVKNNLQVISSLLNLQSKSTNNQQVHNALQKSKDRVQSMALIHEQMYQTPNLVNIDFAEYLKMLTSSLLYSCAANENISLKIKVKDVFLSIEQSTTCGLIVNEVVSNSLRYAFPAGEKGEIEIEIRTEKNGRTIMNIQDNGIGLPTDIDLSNVQSLGLKLIHMFVKQLKGELTIECQEGTRVQITFCCSRLTDGQFVV